MRGLISHEQYKKLQDKENALQKALDTLPKTFRHYEGKNVSLAQLLARPELDYNTLRSLFPQDVEDFGQETNQQIELNIKYKGYISRQYSDVEKLSNIENIRVGQRALTI